MGRETTRTIGEVVSLTSSYDVMSRLTTQEVSSRTGSIQHRAYAYRADGALTSVTDALTDTRGFDLDGAGRVTAVRADRWTERYAYDEAGNQTEADWQSRHPAHAATGPRAYEGNRITQAGTVRYEHDAQGRTVLRQKTRLSRKPDTWRYEWDPEDRLRSVTTPDGTVWRYTYDPLGRRISEQSPVETVHFTWDGTTLCEQTTDQIVLTWDHAGLRPLAQTERRTDTDDDRFFAIVTDLIGTPTELVSESGELAWHTRTTLRFPGQYYDPESGLRRRRALQLLPLLRPGIGPLPHPGPTGPGAGSEPRDVCPRPPYVERPSRVGALCAGRVYRSGRG